jgi:hypothetical protein
MPFFVIPGARESKLSASTDKTSVQLRDKACGDAGMLVMYADGGFRIGELHRAGLADQLLRRPGAAQPQRTCLHPVCSPLAIPSEDKQ